MLTRPRARRCTIAIAIAVVLLLTACEPLISHDVDALRAAGGRSPLPVSDVLSASAEAHAAAMCTARQVSPSAAPMTEYDPETAVAVHELVGSAPLDPTVVDGVQRNALATNSIWNEWKLDPALTDARWNDQGVGEVTCGDGRIYATLVLRQLPAIPPTGIYSSPQYNPAGASFAGGVQYGSAVDYSGTTIPLRLDLWVPPAGSPTPHPTIVLIHGGAFVGGSRTDMGGVAQAWIMRGYAVVSIDYRLDPRLIGPHTAQDQLNAATNAILDAQESVRWLKAHASTYALDVTRIGAVGYSAGGAIALGLSAVPDTHPASPYAAFSPSIAAAVSTGAYLTPGLDAGVLQLHGTESPILMFHYETDVASASGPYAFRTCTAYRVAGSTCDYVSQAGEGHTTDLTPGSVWWSNEVGPFIWEQLHLA